MKSLNLLNLGKNNIPELRDDWLSNGPPYIYIKGNNITKIGRNAFSQLNNLLVLSLEDNRFGAIKRSMFPRTADNLKWLYLE